MAVKFKFSICKQYSNAPATTMKKSSRFHESAKYVFLPYIPIAIILIVSSKEKNAKMMSSKICNGTTHNGKRTSRILCIYKCVEMTASYLQNFTSICHACIVNTRLIHAQCNTVEQNNQYRNSFKPCILSKFLFKENIWKLNLMNDNMY